MSEAKAGGAVSTYTVIGTVDANGKAQPLSTTPLSVESRSVVRTGYTYTNGLLTSYTEGGVVWTIARNADGSIASVTHA